MNAYSDLRRCANLGDSGSPAARGLLGELRLAYAKVDECLAELQQVTAGHGPNMAELATARFRMSQARHAKRQLVNQACELLLSGATAEDSLSVLGIQRANADYFRASTEHVRHWTPRQLQSDWRGFCDASRRMRTNMKHLVALEQKVLLPMLARHLPGERP